MRSLHSTLALILLAGFSLLVGAAGWLIHYLVRDALLERFDAKLRVEALTIVTYTEQEREGVDVEFTDRYFREFDDEVATHFFQVWHQDGETIERSDSLRGRDLPRPAKFGSLSRPFFSDLELPEYGRVRAVGMEFVPHADPRDRRRYDPDLKVGLLVGALRNELDETLGSLRDRLLGAGVVAIAVAVVLVSIALRKGLAPLRRVADQASAIDASTLGTRFPKAGVPTELQPICGRLNELLARLEASFERERRFSADAAHELRTPIAELRSLSEVALRWPPDAEEGHQTFREFLGIARRMESLVTALQTITRFEAGAPGLQAQVFPLSALLEPTVAGNEAAARHRGIQIRVEMPSPLMVASDRALLEAIVGNLLANAVEYAPEGDVVRIEAGEDGKGAVQLAVSNQAPDLEPADLPRLVERFWRKDVSRCNGQHSGLGLSVVKAAAEALGAEVAAELGKDQRLTVRILGLRASPNPGTWAPGVPGNSAVSRDSRN